MAAGTVYGLGAGTVSLASNTLTYSVTTPIAVAASIPIYVSFTGLTNTSTAGSYTSTITTIKAGPTNVTRLLRRSVTFGSVFDRVTVTVGQTLTFTNNMTSFTLAVDPSQLNNVASQTVVLTVQTNAASGYTLAAADTGLSRTSPAFTIPAVSSGPGDRRRHLPDAVAGVRVPPSARAAPTEQTLAAAILTAGSSSATPRPPPTSSPPPVPPAAPPTP